MSETRNKFYLTTPIYYVNARPHIGHAYSTIAADVIARRHRLLGDDTFFLTGTDEHGQKIQRAALAAGVPPQQYADQVSATFRDLWKRMGILNDSLSKNDSLLHRDYIRTTDARHVEGVQKLWRELEARGAIYLSTYTGQYSVGEEMFVEGPPGTIGPDGKPTETVTEENYFFRLSQYQEQLINLIESGELHIQPETTRNEVLSFVRGGLKDLSISRTTFDWGIPVPGNPKHVIYVWLDALANYMTAVGYGSNDPAEQKKFKRYWPADLHLVGKEITRFHCVYWPAFLLAAGLPLPKSVVANGWLLFEESKMSKSRGNVVRTETILDAFGEHVYAKQFPESTKQEQDLFAADVLRYYLLREIPFGQDGSFSFDALITRYNADLANGYGNLVSRTLNLIQQNQNGAIIAAVEPWLCQSEKSFVMENEREILRESFGSTQTIIETIRQLATSPESIRDFYVPNLTSIVALKIGIVDGYLSANTPWKLAKSDDSTDRQKLNEVLYTAAESIRIITALLYPILPYATASVWRQLGLGDIEEAARNGELKDLKWGGLKPGTKLGPLAPIFPRADKGLAQIMTDMESPTTPEPTPTESVKSVVSPSPAPATEPAPTAPAAETISIDDFAKVDLRVAQIVVAERIPKADKLLRLEVDLGYERRQILAGIAEHYAPETLIGRKVVIVANLAPRKMRGLESQGMIVAASIGPAGAPVLTGFLEDVELGARLK